jgi:hypothetical protein
MTGSSSPSEPPKQEQSFKSLIAKGTIGAISLAGATAIPLVVQKYLGPSPAASPTPSPSAQIAPAQMMPLQMQPIGDQNQAQDQDSDQTPGKKGKKKGHHKD